MCLRSSPLYNAGALAFNVGNESPRVGEVVTSLWNFAVNKLRFKLISPNGEKEKAAPGATTSAAQDDASPVIGSSKKFLLNVNILGSCISFTLYSIVLQFSYSVL